MMAVFALLLAAHVIGAVLWVGGMAFAILVLRPSLSVLEPPARLALHGAVFSRFFRIVWHAMPILLLSGYGLLFGVFGGFGGVGWPVHVMHLIGLIMATIFIWLYFGPWRAFRASPNPASLARIRHLVTVNLVLGLIAIVLGCFG